jgi:hypothetical protein
MPQKSPFHYDGGRGTAHRLIFRQSNIQVPFEIQLNTQGILIANPGLTQIKEARMSFFGLGNFHKKIRPIVKDRTQSWNATLQRWVKRDGRTGRFLDMKAEKFIPFKGIRKER